MKAKPVQIPSECCRYFECTKKKKRKKLFFSHFVIFGVGLKLKCILMMKYEVNILESFLFCQSRKITYIYIYIIKLFYSLVRSFNFYGYQGIVDENRNVGIFITS